MIEVFDCEQCSPEWYMARLGLPTASEFKTVLAQGKGGGPSKTRLTYMRKLAGEIQTGVPMESYSNPYMERGKAMEDEARTAYAFWADVETVAVGFIKSGAKGCSPDGLIDDAGMVEIKTAAPHILIEKIELDGFPPEHKAQCQGALWVAEREWIDLVIYWPGMPMFTKRAYRDTEYITALSEAVDRFNDELAALVETVRRYGQPSTVTDDINASLEAA